MTLKNIIRLLIQAGGSKALNDAWNIRSVAIREIIVNPDNKAELVIKFEEFDRVALRLSEKE